MFWWTFWHARQRANKREDAVYCMLTKEGGEYR
jgi:hypothetical protein